MNWKILYEREPEDGRAKTEEIIKILLKNRGLKTRKQIEEFLSPVEPEKLTVKDFGLKPEEIKKAIKRIKKAIEKTEQIIVYGDYDADGICATAILWETLYRLTKKALPYIPERFGEGYGFNEESLNKLKEKYPELKLIIAVDHGITEAKKIEYAKSLGIEVIVCDHHQLGSEIPDCTAVVHTEKVCAAAIAWYLAKELEKSGLKTQNDLDLVVIATIADLQPLIGINRNLVKFGLKAVNETKRCGLLAIFAEAGLKAGEIGTYEVGFIIAPRLNAMGRMEHALESLRLVCTSKPDQASNLALKLGQTNRERQLLTEKTALEAKKILKEEKMGKLIFLSSENFSEGIIGLAAGKLTDEFSRPAIVVSRGEVYSKASARSVSGFNIIEAIRRQSDLLIDAGGHPMAAGFTVETTKLEILKSRLEELAEKELAESDLLKIIKIDLELELADLNHELFREIGKLAPFGFGNPEPIFATRNVTVVNPRVVGSEGKHLKLSVFSSSSSASGYRPPTFNAIAFNQGYLSSQLSQNRPVDIAYTLQINRWNGEEKLELKIKDLLWKSV